jgi:type VI secretion system protein VasJ
MEFTVDLDLLGKEPIREGQPTGTDIRYDPVFEELQAEVGKLSSPSGAGSIDWGKIVKLSSEILAQKSKDLLAASYLVVALIYTRKIEGFGIALKVYLDLLETFWDNLFPAKSRMRARVGAIEWWLEKTETALAPFEGASLPEDQLNKLKENFEKIEQFLTQNLEEPPAFSPVWERLKSFSPPQSPTSEKPQEPVPTAAVKAAPAVPREPEVPEVIASSQDAQKVLNNVLQKLRSVAIFLWQVNLSNPQAYRWARMAIWSNVEVLPPATDGQTRIPAPPAQIKNILNELRNKGDYESLLKATETKLYQFIFWIDLNRLVSEALTNLGENYQGAKETVHQETALLIKRLPGLEDLFFADGTPFADAETKKWLKEIAMRIGSGGDGSVPIPEPFSRTQDEDVIGKEVKEAQRLIKKGKLLEAIEGLQQKFRNSLSQKEKLLWRLAFTQLLVNNKQTKLVLPHLDQIIKDIDFYRLEEYDPEIALKGLKVVWLGLHSQPDQTSKEKAVETMDRISKLDLTEAIRMGKG